MPDLNGKAYEGGILQSVREAVIDILELRFEVIPELIVNRLNKIYDPSILKIFRRKAVRITPPEVIEVFRPLRFLKRRMI
ncbi:MAG: hypothetical protein HF982_09665 [Desulfobacteraceae bacterium]|nr:hypothetical protein [Desulfobacteraceae bacterium]MBC2719834.1 hypothetical protein [Desulfobacteraceae bacterium]